MDGEWKPIESRPDEGEFLALIPNLDRSRIMQVRSTHYSKQQVCEPWKGGIYIATLWTELPEIANA